MAAVAKNSPNSETVGLDARLADPPARRGGNLGVDEWVELVDDALPFRDGICGGTSDAMRSAVVDFCLSEAGVLERSITA